MSVSDYFTTAFGHSGYYPSFSSHKSVNPLNGKLNFSFCRQANCLSAATCGSKKAKQREFNIKYTTRGAQRWCESGTGWTKRNIRNKILVLNSQCMHRGNKPRESLLWFDSICINPPNYAFNKWSSPRELLVQSRLAYSRLHNHQLVWGRKKKVREKEKRMGGKWYEGDLEE